MRQSWRKATRMAPGFVLAQFDSFSSVQMPCSKRSTWRLVRNLGTLRCHILAALPQQLLWQTVRPGAAKSQQPNRQAIRLPGKHNVRSRAGFTSNLHTSLHPHRRQPVDRHTAAVKSLHPSMCMAVHCSILLHPQLPWYHESAHYWELRDQV